MYSIFNCVSQKFQGPLFIEFTGYERCKYMEKIMNKIL